MAWGTVQEAQRVQGGSCLISSPRRGFLGALGPLCWVLWGWGSPPSVALSSAQDFLGAEGRDRLSGDMLCW